MVSITRARRNPLPMQRSEKTDRWNKHKDVAMRKMIKTCALQELMKRRDAFGGKAIRGDIIAIVKKYQDNGYDFITKGIMDYLISKHKKSDELERAELERAKLARAPVSYVPMEIRTINDQSQVSDNTEPVIYAVDDTTPGTLSNVIDDAPTVVCNLGGRPKGVKKDEKERLNQVMKQAMMKAASLCSAEKANAETCNTIVSLGKYKEIIELVEQEENLVSGSISVSTIQSRVLCKTLSGFRPQNTSPLQEMEHVIVQYCLKLARMRQPLTREHVIRLAESLIKDTIYCQRMVNLKKKKHLPINNGDTIGRRWYYGFIERNKEMIRRHRGRVVDIK